MEAATRRTYRYSRVAMALHWTIALLVIAMIPMGIWMSDAIVDPERQALAYRMYQLHKSIGFLILALTLARGLWRVFHRPPPSAPSLKGWERFLARATHAAFYAILLLLPLTGWIYVSSGWAVATDQPLNVATSFFGWFEIPHLAAVSGADAASRRVIAFRSMGFHWTMALGGIALILLHTAAALKHHFLDRDGTLASMVPWLRPEEGAPAFVRRGKLLPAMVGVVAIVVAALLPVMLGLTHNPGSGKPVATSGEAPAAAAAQPAIPTAVEPGKAPHWAVAEGASLEFSGAHAGTPFAGGFREWQAHIYFDPQDLVGSKIVILIGTGSAYTGDATQEGTLREAEWFDAKQYPDARFDSSAITPLGGDRYSVAGLLRLKNRQTPLTFEARIRISGAQAEAEGRFDLDRAALDLGMASDPSAQWVSQTIPVKFRLKATKG